MYAVEIWGQERGSGRVSECPTCEQKRRKGKEKKHYDVIALKFCREAK